MLTPPTNGVLLSAMRRLFRSLINKCSRATWLTASRSILYIILYIIQRKTMEGQIGVALSLRRGNSD